MFVLKDEVRLWGRMDVLCHRTIFRVLTKGHFGMGGRCVKGIREGVTEFKAL